MLDTLRRRYPGQRDSVLFCIHKLQQNRDLTLRDFRDEAALHGIRMAGRALHSARILLGLVKAEAKRPAAKAAAAGPDPADARGDPLGDAPRRQPGRRRGNEPDEHGSIEHKVLQAMHQMRSAASAEADGLRAAIKKAIELLQAAIER
jgi:hypothetical protein